MNDFNQIKTGNNPTLITEETINRITKVKMFEDEPELNNTLYRYHKDLLRLAMNKNSHNEIGFLWNIEKDGI